MSNSPRFLTILAAFAAVMVSSAVEERVDELLAELPSITPTPKSISVCEDKCVENVDLLSDVTFQSSAYPYTVVIQSVSGSPALGTNPGGGFVSLNKDSTNDEVNDPILLSYFPELDYSGTVTVTYEICEANGSCATNTLTISVESDACPVGQVCNQPSIPADTVIYADNFNGDRLNDLNSGSLCWSGPWTERDQGVIGPLDFGNKVKLQNNDGGTVKFDMEDGDYIERTLDLSGAIQVTLTFLHEFNFDDDDEYSYLIDPDGAGPAPFIELDNIDQLDSDDNADYVTRSIDVDGALKSYNISNNTDYEFQSDALIRIVETGLNTNKSYLVSWIELEITAGAFTGTYRDDFTNNDSGKGGYDQKTANSACWAGPWVESGDDINGSPYTGDIELAHNHTDLYYKPAQDGVSIKSISRAVDLSSFSSATLSFDLVEENFDGPSGSGQEEIYVEYFDGMSWIRLQTFTGDAPTLGNYTFTLEDKGKGLSDDSAIRITDNAVHAKQLVFDNFVITAATSEQTFCSPCTTCELAYPTAVDDQVDYPIGAPSLTINVLDANPTAADSDPNGQALTVRLDDDLTAPTNGTITTDGTTITYTPNPGTSGSDSFEYRICDPDCRCDIGFVTVSAEADLSLSKQVSYNPATNTASFTIQVVNSGPGAATNITVTDTVPSGYTYTFGSIAGGDTRNDSGPSGAGLMWMINSLSANDSVALTFEATLNASGEYQNQAQITAVDQGDPDSTPNNNIASEDDQDSAGVEVADLNLVKTVDNATPNVGDTIQFSITITNESGTTTATGVAVEDLVPNGYTVVPASISNSGVFSNDTITWTGLTIAANSTQLLTFQAEVLAPGAGVNYVNLAWISATDQVDLDSNPNNQADSNNSGDGNIGSQDADSTQDPGDEDDGDDALVIPFYIDYGDLADTGAGTGAGNYETLSANGGPSHVINPDLKIGATVDNEADGQQDTAAGISGIGGDDNDGADDEDGVNIFAQTYKAGNTVNIPVVVTNNTTSDAILYAFVDWNNNGEFSSANEQFTVSVPAASGTTTVLTQFMIPTEANGAAINSQVGARFRLTTDILNGNTWEGPASDGEVEDYVLQIICPVSNCLDANIILKEN